MSSSKSTEDDFLTDCWLSSWEQQTIQDLENAENLDNILISNTDTENQKLWALFQNAAQCIAVMYKGATDNPHSLWLPFQTAAGNVTALYKDSIESVRRLGQLGIHAGHQRRTREILNWVRRRRHFRRDELLAFLAGKNPPPHRHQHLRGSPRTKISLDRMSPRLPSPHHPSHTHNHDPDLSTFREALGISVGSPTLYSRHRGSAHPELQSFLSDEFARHKRPAPSASPTHDVTMDSPQHKRSRYT